MHHSHQLDKQKDQDFLLQQRVDPITGELIEAGHKIVICSACKSAFFEESWEYLGGKHCNQKDTLKELPVFENLSIKIKELDFEFEDVELIKVPILKKITGQLVGGIVMLSFFFFGVAPCLILLSYSHLFIEEFLAPYIYVPMYGLIALSMMTFTLWMYIVGDRKLIEKSKAYRRDRRIVMRELVDKEGRMYRLAINAQTNKFLMNSSYDEFSVPLKDITNLNYTFKRVQHKVYGDFYKLELKVIFNFINHEDFTQKIVITQIKEEQIAEWNYFIKRLPPTIKIQTTGLRI